ncbi:tol-pal system protein YbgF [Mameliella sediminis]|uniref:tol-pal system protein YbgF n=1 Tax=Mameliella sediminis TaxID=2836866 RepID=UPI001C4775D5|nr:tol-pal system protein YbgF [Mameliella sediminis]MBY6113013.1 tol-pal system protein YbgF [Antarctobacter heliothermus]MBY6143639.1 tol-pal system protein YbgF [Mameliella alba]MBV7394295.1 tol-pal system protein YbgF [Mameliella sediminis]MBY6162293.1 tol-pal system protein YbgF [Mameliella alba]MBY6170767.1 tol-pal system protein YbgF [Mameliella alba]
MLRALVFGSCLLAGGMAAAQQGETLADVRQDLAVLTVELRKLRSELNTTGAPSVSIGGSALDRITAIERELQRLTAKTEELEFRLGRVVEDGTNRIGDLKFRLCELEPGCDIGKLAETDPLGGGAVPSVTPAQPAPAPATDALPFDGELAVSEEADFRAALKALEEGDYSGAELLFAQFRETYPMGPLEPAALVGEGRALEAQGDTREAARRYLSAYSGFPDAGVAPEALWRLGDALAALGSVSEACITLGEVAARYPGSDAVAQAAASRQKLNCQ